MTKTIITPDADLHEEATVAHEQSQATIQSAIRLLESDDGPTTLDSVCQLLSESLRAKSRWNRAWRELESRHDAYRTSP